MENFRRLAYIVVFGALWGGAEMVLGGTLHALHIPKRGMVMATIGAFLLCSARIWIGGKGSSITIGGIAAVLKLFSVGGLVLSPAMAIFLESLTAEICFLIAGEKLFGCIIAGSATVTYTVLHRIFALTVVYRSEISEFYQSLTSENALFGKIGLFSLVLVLIIYLLIHIISGGLAGGLAYFSISRAKRRKSMVQGDL